MYEGSVCVWDVDMVAMHASGMSVFVFGVGWCNIDETIANTLQPHNAAYTTEALYFQYEVRGM